MSTIYWVHDNGDTTIYRWNGSVVDSFVMSPWVEMGNLMIGKNGCLVVSHWPETDGQYAFTLQTDMTTKMSFPTASVGGVALYHDSWQGLSCYDPGNDCYWMSLDPTRFSSLSGGVANPLWAKHSTVDGSLISVHADDAAFPHVASVPAGQKTQIHNGYLYWTSKYQTGFSGSGAQALHRMNTSTYDWEWCWSYPQGGTANGANSRWFLGFNGDDLWMQWYDPVNADVWFERYDLSALTWSDHTSSTAQGLPAYTNRWFANPDESIGQQAGSTALNGWVTIESGAIYFGGYNNGGSSVWTMNPATGASSELFLTGTGEYVMGMAVVASRIGQLYVNLSTEQNNPNWVSVCPVDGGKAGHFNMSATTTPDWYLLHQDYFRVNISTTETPDWWEVCTHNN